ncbi:unnamed protein product [Adineta ricciae]|uniref:non-specific serine/threonine protein kinase n=1 Tax=Adineta ricciae TaxID=249248 RepID=A0A815TEE6_ADIRI|nr:unnamed protein product [Adineta ricciae]
MWQFTETLGEGAYGEVVLAKNINTNEFAAVKVIDINRLKGNDVVIRKEIDLHKLFRHENIIRFYGYKQQYTNYYLFLEYAAGGELFDKIEPDVGMPEYLAQHYFKQVVAGMAYLHSLGVAHRDLKPENLLIANNNVLKICDFGLATLFRSQTTREERKLTTYCGTAPYSSPEVWAKTPYRGEPVDVWSSGIILTAMLTGELPWDQPSYQNPEYKRWLDRDYYHNPWKKIDNMILNLLRRILIHDPAQRARVPDIQSHKWMLKVYPQDGTESDHQVLKRMAVKYEEPCWSLTQPNQSTTSTVISSTSMDDPMVTCISQPIKLDDLILITEPRSLAEMGDDDPSEHLVHRMTRVVLAMPFDDTIYLLNKLFVHTGYTPKRTAGNQITVVTQDKRHTELIFKVNVFKIPDNKIMADFRLSKGDGIEFKRKFVEIRDRLVQLATAWSSGAGSSTCFNHTDTSSTLTAGNNSVNQLQEAMDT